ncbi:MAG: hypothetical protein ACR2MP_17955 [Streptosporangiaceae bacterium]
MGRAELLTSVVAPALAAEPLAVEQLGASEFDADAGAAEPTDCVAVVRLGVLVFADQCPRTFLEPECPVGAARADRSTSRSSDAAANWIWPVRLAASTSSTRLQLQNARSSGYLLPRLAALRASS